MSSDLTPARLEELLAAATPGPWHPGRSDAMSYDASGTIAFKNVYADDPRGGVHNGQPLPLTVAKAVDEAALHPQCNPTALADSEIHANAALIALSPALAARVIELEGEKRALADKMHGLLENATVKIAGCLLLAGDTDVCRTKLNARATVALDAVKAARTALETPNAE